MEGSVTVLPESVQREQGSRSNVWVSLSLISPDRQSTNCWDLASFLIKPVQRITKYQLLLKEIIKYTSRAKENCHELEVCLEPADTGTNLQTHAKQNATLAC